MHTKVTPKDVYSHFTDRGTLIDFLKKRNYRVIDFRPPCVGDAFLSAVSLAIFPCATPDEAENLYHDKAYRQRLILSPQAPPSSAPPASTEVS